MNFSIGVNKIITPDTVIDKAYISIEDGKIKEINKSKPENLALKGDYLLFPGLINSHDHLIGGYYPKAGKGPYINWLPWDYDLKKAKVYEERGKIANLDLYYLSCYRLLVSGVTSVSDHVVHALVDAFADKMPIHVLKEFSLAHECSSYDLRWGAGIEVEHKKALENNEPFITHINEGFDEEARKGISYLLEKKALSEHTVLIHGIAYSDEDIKNIARQGANHVWCPQSNYYMFGITSRIKEIREHGINVSLGTDSPMSGGQNLLEEARFGKRLYKEMYSEELEDKALVMMMTKNGAKALRLLKRTGTVEEGKDADILLIKDTGADPYSALVNAKLSDIMLLVYKGHPVYADESLESLFNTLKISYKRINIDKVSKLMYYGENYPDLAEILDRIKSNVGYNKKVPFLPVG
jgi:cytosine/adenosine deaminase-related metal-dependent hydrolase